MGRDSSTHYHYAKAAASYTVTGFHGAYLYTAVYPDTVFIHYSAAHVHVICMGITHYTCKGAAPFVDANI